MPLHQPTLSTPSANAARSGSTDRSSEIARDWGARTAHRKFDDFAVQKQACVDLAAGDWVLSLDADERLTPASAEEIAAAVAASEHSAGFLIPFEVEFMGEVLRWGGLGGERHLRLFRRAKGRFGGKHLHEGVTVDGPVRTLLEPVKHRPYSDLGEYIEKMSHYTERASRRRWEAGRRLRWSDHLRPAWEIFVRLVLKGGILDGRPGVVWALLSAFHTWLKYARLADWERGARR